MLAAQLAFLHRIKSSNIVFKWLFKYSICQGEYLDCLEVACITNLLDYYPEKANDRG